MLSSLFVVIFFSCRDTIERPPGILVVSKEQQSTWVRNFNPLSPGGQARWPTSAGIYEPLLIYNAMQSKYISWLATSYEWNEQATELQINIRQNVQWSDGEPFDAEDVQYSFDILREHPALDQYALRKELIDVSIIDSHQLVFRFSKPSFSGLEKIAHHPIIAHHIWQKIEDPLRFENPSPVGTGPFTEVKRFEGQVWELERNPYSWAKPKVQTLRFPAFSSNEQATLALLNDEVDWAANFIPVVERIYVEPDPENHHYWYPNVEASVLLYPNNTRPPFDNVEARKALSMAIDRNMIIKIAMHNYTKTADETGLSDAFNSWRNPQLEPHLGWASYSPQQAAETFDRLGYTKGPDGWRQTPEGQPIKWKLAVVSGWSDWVRAVHVMARNLQDIGFQVQVEARDFGYWFQQLQKGDFDLSIGWSTIGTTPVAFYQGMMAQSFRKELGELSPVNWHRHGNPEIDELVDQFEATADRNVQIELVKRMQLLFVQQAPALPLFLNPSWGQCNTKRFTGFPSAKNPYARLSPNHSPESLLVLTRLEPVE